MNDTSSVFSELRLLALVTLAGWGMSWPAQGETVHLTAAQSTFVSKWQADTGKNFSNRKCLEISGNPANAKLTLLQWDLSSLPKDIRVEGCKLTVRKAFGVNLEKSSRNVLKIQLVTSAWQAAEVTSDSRPTLSVLKPEVVLDIQSSDLRDTVYTLEGAALTAIVQGWISGDVPNYGLALSLTGVGALALNSGLSDTGSPSLEVTYTQIK